MPCKFPLIVVVCLKIATHMKPRILRYISMNFVQNVIWLSSKKKKKSILFVCMYGGLY